MADLDEAIALDSSDAEAYYLRGYVHQCIGEHSQAIADYDKAIELDPKAAEAYYNRGLAYKEQGRKAEALADFRTYVTLSDNPGWIEDAKRHIATMLS